MNKDILRDVKVMSEALSKDRNGKIYQEIADEIQSLRDEVSKKESEIYKILELKKSKITLKEYISLLVKFNYVFELGSSLALYHIHRNYIDRNGTKMSARDYYRKRQRSDEFRNFRGYGPDYHYMADRDYVRYMSTMLQDLIGWSNSYLEIDESLTKKIKVLEESFKYANEDLKSQMVDLQKKVDEHNKKLEEAHKSSQMVGPKLKEWRRRHPILSWFVRL